VTRGSWAEGLAGAAVGFAVTAAVAWALPPRAATPSGEPAAARPTPAPATAADPASPAVHRRVLSRPGHLSRYAFVDRPVTVRARPDPRAPALGRLATRTPDATDELVLALRDQRGADGARWVRVRTPLLPAGTIGWVPRGALSTYRRVHTWLLIDRAALRARLVRDGVTILTARIAVGAHATPTPAGRFYVRDRLPRLDPAGAYGPEALGTSARSTKVTDWPGGDTVGLHGTDDPNSIPGRVSHGCVRLRNEDILAFARAMPVGTPVTIR
jgi:L,D-transpeptidase catalytic domain